MSPVAVAATTMGVIPMSDRVILEIDEEPDQRPSGIFIPQNAKYMPQTGTVVAKGDSVLDEGLEPGAKVIYNKYSGKELLFNDKKYWMICEEDILGVMEE